MAHSERAYLPAAGHDWFLPIYDPLTRLLGFESARRRLIEQAALQPDHQVLDVGCGTGTLAVSIKRLHPTVSVLAIDPDPKALARAGRKARRASVDVRFERGFAEALGYADASFDRVFSSMMLHHIPRGDRERALQEMRRVLKPGGRLELLDFAVPEMHTQRLWSRLIHSSHHLADNTDQHILDQLTRAGFDRVRKVGDRSMLFGRIGYFEATA